MVRKVVLALAVTAASLYTAEAFVPSGVSQLPALRRDGSATCSVTMSAEGRMDRRAALLTTLLGVPALSSRPVDAAGFSLVPPALQQAAKAAKKKKGEEVEEEAASAPEPAAEAAPAPPVKKKRGGIASMMPEKKEKKAAPKEEVAATAEEAAPAPAPKKSSVRGFKLGRKAGDDGAAAKQDDDTPAPKLSLDQMVKPEFDKDAALLKKQRVAGATGKEGAFDNKTTLSLEEKLKARAAKTDKQFETMKSQTVVKEDASSSSLPKFLQTK